jgi:hypothetical protein
MCRRDISKSCRSGLSHYGYGSPPQRRMSRDEEREAIIAAGERFCAKYPDDKVCHPPKE